MAVERFGWGLRHVETASGASDPAAVPAGDLVAGGDGVSGVVDRYGDNLGVLDPMGEGRLDELQNGHDDLEPNEVGDSSDAILADSSGDWSVPEVDPDAGDSGASAGDSEPVGDVASNDPKPETDPEGVGYPGMMIDHQHTETLLMDLRAEPLRLVRAYYDSQVTHYIGDENARQALHLAGNEDEYRAEKLAWMSAMDAVLADKLEAIQSETDPMALVNYRSEAEGWPAPPVVEYEYEDDEPEGE